MGMVGDELGGSSEARIGLGAALALVRARMPGPPDTNREMGARQAIAEWCGVGELQAVAQTARGYYRNQPVDDADWPVPHEVWSEVADLDPSWERSALRILAKAQLGRPRVVVQRELLMVGVSVSRDDLDRLIAELPTFEPKDIANLQTRAERQGRPPANWWPDFAEELAVYVHEHGLPSGDDHQGQSALIEAVCTAMVSRGKADPGRTTIQPVVNNLLARVRQQPAGK